MQEYPYSISFPMEYPSNPYATIYENVYSYREENRMSLSITFIGTDGIVMATDSRLVVQQGEFSRHRDNEQKLWKIEDNYGLTCVDNHSGYANFLREEFISIVSAMKKKSGAKTINIREMVKMMSLFLKGQFAPYAEMMSDTILKGSGYTMEFVLAGYMGKNPKVFKLSSQATKYPFSETIIVDWCPSGISSIANYWMEKLRNCIYEYSDNKVIPREDVETLKKIAVIIIDETSQVFSDYVGGAIQVAIIKPDMAELFKVDESVIANSGIRQITSGNMLLDQIKRLKI